MGGMGGGGWGAEEKAALLTGSGVGSTHFLKQMVRPSRVLTAVAICSICEEEEMESTGARSLLVGPPLEEDKIDSETQTLRVCRR